MPKKPDGGTMQALSHDEARTARIRDLNDALVKRGWLCRINGTSSLPGAPNATARYGLGGGPEDLILTAHADTGDST
jgi:hypothetical protein